MPRLSRSLRFMAGGTVRINGKMVWLQLQLLCLRCGETHLSTLQHSLGVFVLHGSRKKLHSSLSSCTGKNIDGNIVPGSGWDTTDSAGFIQKRFCRSLNRQMPSCLRDDVWNSTANINQQGHMPTEGKKKKRT